MGRSTGEPGRFLVPLLMLLVKNRMKSLPLEAHLYSRQTRVHTPRSHSLTENGGAGLLGPQGPREETARPPAASGCRSLDSTLVDSRIL